MIVCAKGICPHTLDNICSKPVDVRIPSFCEHKEELEKLKGENDA